jgi:hypothetical protein
MNVETAVEILRNVRLRVVVTVGAQTKTSYVKISLQCRRQRVLFLDKVYNSNIYYITTSIDYYYLS